MLGGLDVLENEPSLRLKLLDNVRYAIGKLSPIGIHQRPAVEGDER